MKFLYIIISGLMFRIRGGLKVFGKKLPLCKWWFSVWFACLGCILTEWSLNNWLVLLIATQVSTSCFGWGEHVGCVTGISKPNPDRSDCAEIDEFIDNLHIGNYKLTDYPILFGWVGLSLRGLILSFIIGLALNNIPFMLCGFSMGTVYYLTGLFARKILNKYDKTGWNLGEYCFGAVLSIFLIMFIGG